MTTLASLKPQFAPQDEVRPYPVPTLRDTIANVLATVDPREGVAFVASYDLSGEARIAVMVPLGSEWSFGGYMERRPSRPIEGGAMVAWRPTRRAR